MKITPIEIRQKQFEKKTFGGVDPGEVAAYLSTLSTSWERMLDDQRELKERYDKAVHDAQELRKIESSLYNALKTAEQTGADMVQKATQQSALQVREAELKAEAILKEARWQAKTMLEEARQEARRTFQQLREQVTNLENEVRDIERYRSNLISDLRLLSQDIVERADRYARHQPSVDLSAGRQHTEPDFTPSPELQAALNEASLKGPATSSPKDEGKTEAHQNFFDTIS